MILDAREAASSPAEPASLPRRFCHLVWEHELGELREVLEALRRRRDEVLGLWHDLYLVHLGDARSLAQPEFMEIFGEELDSTCDDLLRADLAGFARHVKRTAAILFERGVPFSEVVISLHLLEEAALAVFPDAASRLLRTHQLFDKLGHCRAVLLAGTYFRTHTAFAEARLYELERAAAQLPVAERSHFYGLVGASPVMHDLYQRVEAAGNTRGTVLIAGESGTGKELVARAIHECGSLPRTPFVALNCAALPRELIESELFGYRRGAFSGARGEYLGLFRAAEGGTLFLDEITEMIPETQSKLLRAIQERRVRPVGSTREVPVTVRLIASTNRDPEAAVAERHLRQDLYYRLQANVLRTPRLREHPEDVPLLARHFVAFFNERLQRPTPVLGIEEEALEAMQCYPWPGNVRELANAIESAFTFGPAALIRLVDLPAGIIGARGTAASAPYAAGPGRLATFAEVERNLVRRAIEVAGGNKSRAARLLGISRKKLYAKIAKYGLG